jgi:putative ABC transport system permease protein
MRALGFMPPKVAGFVLAESAAVGLLGGAVGLLLSYPVVQEGMGRFLEENMGAFFPYFRIAPRDALIALGLAVVLAVAAAGIPAWRAAKVNVVDALRRVG